MRGNGLNMDQRGPFKNGLKMDRVLQSGLQIDRRQIGHLDHASRTPGFSRQAMRRWKRPSQQLSFLLPSSFRGSTTPAGAVVRGSTAVTCSMSGLILLISLFCFPFMLSVQSIQSVLSGPFLNNPVLAVHSQRPILEQSILGSPFLNNPF